MFGYEGSVSLTCLKWRNLYWRKVLYKDQPASPSLPSCSGDTQPVPLSVLLHSFGIMGIA